MTKEDFKANDLQIGDVIEVECLRTIRKPSKRLIKLRMSMYGGKPHVGRLFAKGSSSFWGDWKTSYNGAPYPEPWDKEGAFDCEDYTFIRKVEATDPLLTEVAP